MDDKTQFSKPPKDFNPLSASNRELVKYGYPPRPDETKCPRLFERWQKVMSRPLFMQLPEPKPSTVANLHLPEKPTLASEQFFAGVIFGQSGSPLTTVTASWAVPNANIPLSVRGTSQPAGTTFNISVWIGLDGVSVDSSGDTLFSTGMEVGTTSTVTVNGQQVTNQTAYAWYRPATIGPTTPWTAVPVNPGDVVGFTVCSQPSGSVWVTGGNISSGKGSLETNLISNLPGVTAHCLIGIDDSSVLLSPPGTPTADFADVFIFGIGAGNQSTEYNLNDANANIVNYSASATNPIATSTVISDQILEVATVGESTPL